MSYSWTVPGIGFDDEPRNVHPLSCQIWKSDDPGDDCDCGAADFQTTVNQWVAKFERYAPQQGRAS